MINRLLMAMLAAMFAHTAAGQIMECVDAKGNKTMAQFCPPGTVKETQLRKDGTGATTSTSSPAAGSKSLAEREAEFKKRNLERQDAESKAEKAKAESAANQQNCDSARAQLRGLQDGVRISKTDPNTGERSFLEDGDRPAEIEKAQKAVANWCK
jgi:hypothetical protein